MATTWLSYFGGIRESAVHRDQSALYVRNLIQEVGVHSDYRVLDFGCGFGTVVTLLSPHVDEICGWDPSPAMRASTEDVTATVPNAGFCDLSSGDVDARGTGTRFDLVLVNSVAQYMPPAELTDWLPRWRRMLAPGGAIVLSDLIAPDHGSARDVLDLLTVGLRRGSLLGTLQEALGSVGEYRRVRRAVPLVTIGPEELTARASLAGLRTTVLRRNLTHFSTRWSAMLHEEVANRAPP